MDFSKVRYGARKGVAYPAQGAAFHTVFDAHTRRVPHLISARTECHSPLDSGKTPGFILSRNLRNFAERLHRHLHSTVLRVRMQFPCAGLGYEETTPGASGAQACKPGVDFLLSLILR